MHRFALLLLLIVAIMLVGCPFEKNETEDAAAPEPKTFGMPTLIDKSLEEAQDVCNQWELNLAVMEERCDHGLEPGTVMSQWPHPYDQTTTGTTVVVVVSKRAEMVRMPNIHNNTLAQAEQKLHEVGLRIHPRKQYRYDGSVREGRLLDYDPGQKVYEGSEVQVVISKGPIPNGEGEVRPMRLSE